MSILDKVLKPKVDKYYDQSGYRFHFPVSKSEKTIRWNVTFNVTKRNMYVVMKDEYNGALTIYDGSIGDDNGVIQGVAQGKVLFAITSKSKDYGELFPFIDRPVERFNIKEYEGQYGRYYRVTAVFEVVRD